MKFKGVYQYNMKDCGVACLLSIIKYYGGNNTFENIRYLTKCDNNGITALNLIEASKKLGFNSKGIKCDIDYLKKIKLPAIANVTINNYYHYIVILKINKDYIFIFDPYKGNIKYKYDEFNNIWNKIIIELIPYRKIDNIKIDTKKLFLPILKTNKTYYILIFITSIISIILAIFINYYFKALIDNKNILNIFIIFSLIVIIKEIFDYVKNLFIIKLENNIDLYININTHNKLLSLPYYYFNSRSIGDIISRINDLEYLKDIFIKIPIFFTSDFLLIILSAIILINVNKNLFFIFLIFSFLYFFVLIIFNKKNKELIRINQENNAINNEIIIDNIKSINTIKNLNIVDIRNKIYKDNFVNYLKYKVKYEKTYSKENLIKNIILLIGINLVLYIGIINVRNNIILLSDLILFNSIMLYFIEPLKSLYESSFILKNGISAFKRINDIFSITTRKELQKSPSNFNIKIKNLSYSYDNYKYILNNINLFIKEKDKILVIGPSGCGKSTLFKLINKTYEIEDNKIYLGNIDINKFDTSDYISYVSQEEAIFKDTLYNNLALYKNTVVKDKILNITNLYKVMLNKKINMNSLIEEDASNYSKGERQKIILTRVLLQNKKILILDEALSGIDEYEEYEILKRILLKFKNNTIIYITHRSNCNNLFNKIIDFNKIGREYERIN